ncbi:hypothetical protein BDZ90DRAFT_231569 [Jaminaea rosea]|uniref:non-specific serine/threonine protein kinase n=1 Tax=Jaminaea rosea TaxID=1569628 RepID=A0A316UTG6_9BASI|nr:hypothetical protein BDZ90DRAFT_231569 [Jaminaea rosea]PWN28586.1 hypothetical protein BDZ90DRAFT_231569 [Jaminaea rosea]
MQSSEGLPRLLQLACFLVVLITAFTSTQSLAQSNSRQASARALQHRSSPPTHPRASVSSLDAPSAIDNLYLADLVILSAIDGSLTAVDRTSGKTQWILDGSSISLPPLVSSHYGKRRSSLARILSSPLRESEGITGGDDEEYEEANVPIDGLPPQTRHLLNVAGMYVVEPGSSGRLYLLTADEGRHRNDDHSNAHGGQNEGKRPSKARLQRLPLTLPQLVGLSPFTFPGDRGRVFTGTKRTRLLRIDVITGQLDISWEADGSEMMDPISNEQGAAGRDYRWTYLARTDYTLSISLPRRPHLSQTLQYSTYSPQSADADVAARWVESHESLGTGAPPKQGVTILPAGLDREGRAAKVTAWNTTMEGKRQSWTASINSQVVDVFDVLLPDPQTPLPVHPHPIVVPHPPFARAEGFEGYEGEEDDDDLLDLDDETLLTLSPETGSLYAMSSQRFPGVLRDIKPAIAGLDEGQRAERGLIPGSDHQPMQCRTFGCWMGRYRVEDVDVEQRQALDKYGLPGGSRRTPLEISDRAANPDHQTQRDQQAAEPSPSILERITPARVPSKKTILTQVVAVAVIAVLTLAVRRGLVEQRRIQQGRSHAAISQLDLQWQSTLRSNDEEGSGAVESITTAGEGAASKVEEIVERTPPAAVTEAERAAQADQAAASLLAEEIGGKEAAAAAGNTTADSAAAGVKKKRRKRGKRSGAAVRARQGTAGADEESGSEGEGAADGGFAKQVQRSNGESTSMAKNGSSSTLSNGWIQIGPGSQSAQDQLVALANSQPQGDAAASATPALQLSDEVLGYGSSGTVVFKGRFQNRLVAVKRLLVDFVHLASQEISLLESADDHPNVIRYFYKEQVGNFLFIALELCPASLGDLVEKPDEWQDLAVRLEPKRAIKEVAGGLRHLHGLSIVHRDIKPQNILVAYANPHAPKTSPLKMLLSDFGLSKRLDSVAQSSFSQTMHHPGGTAGWRAPEILRGDVSLEEASGGSQSSSLTAAQATNMANGSSANGSSSRTRLTRAVDIFALGCLSYYLLTSGDHPFGARYEREVNIMRNQSNLSRLEAFGEEGHEASHLIRNMIQPEPTGRLRAVQVLAHPYFWDSAKRLGFLQDVSDRLEVIEREKAATGSQGAAAAAAAAASSSALAPPPPPDDAESSLLLRQLESSSRLVTEGGDWTRKVDKAFMDDLGKWRKYHGSSVRDLLRALRNKKHHYQDMPPALRRSMGAMPEGFLGYFTRRFPKLFLHVYEVVEKCDFVKSESAFRTYFADQEQM